MRRASVLAGVPFRTALLFLVVFGVVLAVAGLAILRTTEASLANQARAGIAEEMDLMHDAYLTGGQVELLRFVHSSVATRPDRQFAIGLFDGEGHQLEGNIDTRPDFIGWGTLEVTGQDDGDAPFIAYAEAIGDDLVVVGHAQTFLAAVSASILNALIMAGVVICAAALGIGYLLSSRVSSKLAVIDAALDEVSRGNSDVRLPVGRSNDQIDHVSRQINAHLDRLSDLMVNMRNTIVAIAHDLKSPLNRAFLQLQDAANENNPARATQMLDASLVELETLGGILETVLRISRIESSDDSSSFAVFSATDLMRDLAQTFEPVVEAAGQRLDASQLSGDPALVFGDRKMVAQMLVNLIENASRYAGPGATISLSATRGADGTSLAVADNGPGIPAALRDEVFRPFMRINPERNSPGAGLGLALVKAVANRHHTQAVLEDNKPGLRASVTFAPMAVPLRSAASP